MFAVVILAGAAMLVGVGAMVVSELFGPKRRDPEKGTPYECGAPPLGSAREPFTVKFYLVAILFILFDIETVFLIPYAVVFRELGVFGLVEIFVFIAILGTGLLYCWKRGALEWD
jgi:NADH-quinone oxidoreductase subunit A